MPTIETDTMYARFDEQLGQHVNLYIDASYSSDEKMGKHAKATFSSGWVVKSDKGMATSYGMNVFYDEFVTCPQKAELRSILSFLDMLYDNFPDFINRKQSIRIHCDNKPLMECITASNTSSARSHKVRKFLGKDFERILFYILSMDLEFVWVRGHADNVFNIAADKFAHKGLRTEMDYKKLVGQERIDFISNILFLYHILPSGHMDILQTRKCQNGTRPPLPQFGGAKTKGKTSNIFVAWHCSNKTNQTMLGLSFVSKHPEFHGYITEQFETRPSVKMMAVRTIQYALFQRRVNDSIDLNTPVIIRVQGKRIKNDIQNLLRGKVNKSDDQALITEVDNLQVMLRGMTVRVLEAEESQSQQMKVAFSLAGLAATYMENESFNSVIHQGKVKKSLASLK